ncbi:MAG: hypothetical protein AAF608_01120 [Pseudomonadota bacterium]
MRAQLSGEQRSGTITRATIEAEPQMAGETTLARSVVGGAITSAQADGSQSADSVLHALLGEVLNELSKSRSRADLDSFISYHLDNLGEDEWVITRGC